MEELKEARRQRKENDSSHKQNFTEKMKYELQNW
jgi:hypothetical protein